MSAVEDAIRLALNHKYVFAKILTANDTGQTGGHQSGFLIPKKSVPMFFNEPGVRGENLNIGCEVTWPQLDLTTEVRLHYYGKSTRNEYRMTSFGRGFVYFRPQYTGALLVLIRMENNRQETPYQYTGYVFNTDAEIDEFVVQLELDYNRLNGMIIRNSTDEEPSLEEKLISEFTSPLKDFPSTEVMSSEARKICEEAALVPARGAVTNPDATILTWCNTEFQIFRTIENKFAVTMIESNAEKIAKAKEEKAGPAAISQIIQDNFHEVNSMLNRRKSRAGKSFEHQLAALFNANGLSFNEQVRTEGKKRPDFIFPSARDYHNPDFPAEDLVVLAAKTTCKDRWRQILNEADRVRTHHKYLITMQQGISASQLQEMTDEGVILIVPKTLITDYPKEIRDKIWTVKKFIDFVKDMEKRTASISDRTSEKND